VVSAHVPVAASARSRWRGQR